MQLVPRQGGGELAGFGAAEQVTEVWLANRRLSEHTRAAYRRDVQGWLRWCADFGRDPLRVSFLDVNAYARGLEDQKLAASTVARKLSGLSSWYDFLVKIQARETNPVAGADRPNVSRDHSATVGLTPEEVDALLDRAAEAGTRHHAVMTVLADLGLRVGELVSLNLDDVGWERGHRTVRFVGKGNKARRRALTPAAADALDAYLAVRGGDEGPLFRTSTGARLDRHAIFRLIRRLAGEAGIAGADRLSPHSLRHAFATAARAEGVPLEDVQDAMGHADPRTTRRYDRDRHNLDRDPAYTLAAARARRAGR
ncbi:tyrosine-type recombinase/integrase [Paractinoplanes brasiliensis]|uniref:Site-specific recombinase XerD n=1 Tax=Paractinoplanes brasiliensis TaxID=52695 RepID=A0A4R6JAR0_9ACTN|nr:tyrosine-type recombinase/integrase [Actinoplanes brasiliensis]TDO32021.1 site-specific recombinase XerD [Actinoplanes brasiliensis]GID28066.1 tyrosine recombinase XerD [Actinoplanes brasiliensis]